MNMNKIRFILLSLVFLLSFVFIGCTSDSSSDPINETEETEDIAEGEEAEEVGETESVSEDQVSEEDIASGAVEFSEAPMFAEADLPPVEERLPKQPKLTNAIPAEHLEGGQLEIGQYGGTMRMASLAPDWNPDVFLMFNEPLLNSPGELGQEFTPNIVRDVEMSSDLREFTFHMREGMKWSDGEPLTTEDVAFAVEDVLFNEELTPNGVPSWLRAGGLSDADPMTFEVIDEYTFKISFTEDYGRFFVRLASDGWRGYTELIKPKHYLQDYHVDYTPLEELEPLIEEEGFDEGDWMSLFGLKDFDNWSLTNPGIIDFPVLYPWVMVSTSETVNVFERNPYYWRVDAAGNQLPYIDQVNDEYVQDHEILTQKIIAGEIDMAVELAGIQNIALYRENEENGYQTLLRGMHFAPTVVFLNQTYEDPVWQEVVQDRRFREAMSIAINREEIIDAVYYGFAEVPDVIPSEFDPERANQLLDEMGLDERDNDGFRLGPDGETFVVPFEVGQMAADLRPVTELVVEYWNDVGIRTTMQTIDDALFGTRNAANEIQATVHWIHEPMWDTGVWPDFVPGYSGRLWNMWNTTQGSEGEEPPEHVQRLYELSELIMAVEPGTPEDEALFDEIYETYDESLHQMIIASNALKPAIVSDRMGNVPTDGLGVATNNAGEQMFFRTEE